MNVTVNIDYAGLCVINNVMSALDTIEFSGLKRNLKTIVSICIELREKLLKKAISTRTNKKEFKLKLKFYMAEALLNYLIEFDIFFDAAAGSYEGNTLMIVKNQLHQQLQ
ncbi:hypothetical protein OK18_15315 [Chryseobacterium gallinarum]|uniref:Uncharacterized protein n=1 Tax=Chryseobacterium gallinarum TaxID=1324352 RepID=A0A0G3M9Q4_CHRGL|nr:hypothetical protein [Chryseobacterium gallinarum]AKK73792.1 hypothetical protein OK18_15315 [Chryseobacterium gallinarum]